MEKQKQNQNQNNPVGWFEIYVDNVNRARKFYETVLDVKMEDIPDPTHTGMKMVGFPMKTDKPNSPGAIIQMDGVKAGNNSTIVYFSSKDCSVEEGRVAKAGGEIFKKKMPIGEHGFMSLCKDTEGNMFGLHSMN